MRLQQREPNVYTPQVKKLQLMLSTSHKEKGANATVIYDKTKVFAGVSVSKTLQYLRKSTLGLMNGTLLKINNNSQIILQYEVKLLTR